MVSPDSRSRPRKAFERCPTWHTPLVEITTEGLVFKCPSCHRFHPLSWARLEQIRVAIAAGLDPFAELGELGETG